MTILDDASLFCLVSILSCIYAEDTDRFRQIFAREKGIRLQRHLGQLNHIPAFFMFETLSNFQQLLWERFKMSNILKHVDIPLMCKYECSLYRPSQEHISLETGYVAQFWKYTIVDVSEWFIKTSFSAQCLALQHTVDCSTPNIILWHNFISYKI